MGFVPPPSYFEGREAFEKWKKERENFTRFAIYSLCSSVLLIVFFILIMFLATSCVGGELEFNRRQGERWTRNEKESYLQHTDWTPSIQSAVLQGAVQIGMTAEQVRMSIGKPRVINQTVGRWGVHEQWVYWWVYIYFDNGIVTGWQRKR